MIGGQKNTPEKRSRYHREFASSNPGDAIGIGIGITSV